MTATHPDESDSPPDRFLTPKQAADLFQVSTETLARWADQGLIESIVLPSGHRRYRQSVIDRALQPAPASEAAAS